MTVETKESWGLKIPPAKTPLLKGIKDKNFQKIFLRRLLDTVAELEATKLSLLQKCVYKSRQSDGMSE